MAGGWLAGLWWLAAGGWNWFYNKTNVFFGFTASLLVKPMVFQHGEYLKLRIRIRGPWLAAGGWNWFYSKTNGFFGFTASLLVKPMVYKVFNARVPAVQCFLNVFKVLDQTRLP